jgi:hypothetical protein
MTNKANLEIVTYCGDDPELKGCNAIARKCGQEGFIEVQFTPLHLPKELTHGWTKFAEGDFENVLDDDSHDSHGTREF